MEKIYQKLDEAYNLHLDVDSLIIKTLDKVSSIEDTEDIYRGLNTVIWSLTNLERICNAHLDSKQDKGSTN